MVKISNIKTQRDQEKARAGGQPGVFRPSYKGDKTHGKIKNPSSRRRKPHAQTRQRFLSKSRIRRHRSRWRRTGRRHLLRPERHSPHHPRRHDAQNGRLAGLPRNPPELQSPDHHAHRQKRRTRWTPRLWARRRRIHLKTILPENPRRPRRSHPAPQWQNRRRRRIRSRRHPHRQSRPHGIHRRKTNGVKL